MRSNKYFHKTLSILFFLYAATSLQAQETVGPDFNCFSILAGKNATVDGSVMFAHNEDDWGDRIVNFYKVPAMSHQQAKTITMETGAKLEQVNQTWSYLWLEMPEMEFSDSYMNEWGVTIGSDACQSREKDGDLTDGGIGYWLRRAMAERAKSAREAVKIGGALVEKFGYTSSGRTYCIADPKEAWMLSVVKGKHWVAKRIPDDEVAIIPNYYTITSVNLLDTLNYYGSADLVEYAKKKKWYKPEAMGEFNFREVYSDQQNLENMGNVVRHWSAINQFAAKNYTVDDEFPFSFKPRQKVTLNLLFQVLRNHNEGSEYDESDGYTKGNPHQQGRAICSSTTQYGFAAQLRSDLPVDIGAVLWLAPFRPCVHPFTQWYVGMTKIPEGFSEENHIKALETHFNPIENVFEFAPDNNFLKFVKHAKNVDEDYGNLIKPLQKKIQMLETELLQNQQSFENQLLKLNSPDKRQIQTAVNDYSKKQMERSLELNK